MSVRYKYGKCMRGHVSLTSDWNTATSKFFGLDPLKMETIEETSKNAKRNSTSVNFNTFVCPVCLEKHSYLEIKRLAEADKIDFPSYLKDVDYYI